MNRLIIDISENNLRAVLSCDGLLEYCRIFDFAPKSDSSEPGSAKKQQAGIYGSKAEDNPYLIYYDLHEKRNPWEQALKDVIRKIRADIKSSIDETHLIIPSGEVVIDTHQLPKMSKQDAEKVIGRKISAEFKEGFPPFSIIPSGSDQKTQTWYSLYIPSAVLLDYRKVFSACRLRLSSISTQINAVLDAFRSIRESIFNSHAIFEVRRGFIEAYYISADGMLHFQRLPYNTEEHTHGENAEEQEKAQKLRLFRIIDSIFRINSQYQSLHPQIPIQMAWICGTESGLDAIAAALREAMGLEVNIAPPAPTGIPEESGYVPLFGFADSLHNGTAISYTVADFLKRFPLRKTSALILNVLLTVAAVITVIVTEREYKSLDRRVKQLQLTRNTLSLTGKDSATVSQAGNVALLKKLTERQIVFYDLFRELANDLPDDLAVESLEFSIKDGKGMLDVSTVTHLDKNPGESAPLSRLMAMLDRSKTMKNHREPAISTISRDNRRYIKINFTSEVIPLDKTR